MCMFVGDAKVGGTKIFAKKDGKKQLLVYEAQVDSPAPNAMILPVPVTSPSAAIELIDLSAFPELFDDLLSEYVFMPSFGAPPPQGALEVIRVGSYEASIVPTLSDMARLDARFHIAPSMKDALAGRYADHAFIVYQFAPGKQRLHPFCFSFESRYDRHLFFPTVHIHDGGAAPSAAWFDHHFFAQRSKLGDRYEPRSKSGNRWDGRPRFPSFVEWYLPVEYNRVQGSYANQDLFCEVEG